MTSRANGPARITVLFCEDVREEQGAKHTIVGAYGTVLGMFEPTGRLTQLAVFCTLDLPLEYVGKTLRIVLRDRGDELVVVEMVPEAPETTAPPKFRERLFTVLPLRLPGFTVADGMELCVQVAGAGIEFESAPLQVVYTPKAST